MQLRWRNDADKLTFIICLPPTGRDKRCDSPIIAKWGDSPENMVGDINLFIFEDPHVDEPKEGGYVPDRGQIGKRKLVGEVELMVARREYQGKGIGRASLLLFLFVCYPPHIWLFFFFSEPWADGFG
jgi:GNAT superfamily N-acetyltransferase